MNRRALSLVELLLALSVTAMVATAIAGMMGAVSSGAMAQHDLRAVTVLANAASTRLNSYIVPSRCILNVDGADVTLWFSDARESGTVHASEIRWLRYDAPTGALNVHYVKFPEGWTQAACDLEDLECPVNTNWDGVFSSYKGKGWMGTRTLIDHLSNVAVLTDAPQALNSRVLTFQLEFAADGGVGMIAGTSISQHVVPAK